MIMRRRDFGMTVMAGTAGLGAGVVPNPATMAAAPTVGSRANQLMHVGGDYHHIVGRGQADMTSKANLEYNLRHGVRHLTIQVSNRPDGNGWDLDNLKRMRDKCDRLGVVLEAIRMDPNYIKAPKGVDRERELELVLANIAKAGEVGVKVITYHWTVIPIRRNRNTPGRGGSTYAGFKLEDDWQALPAVAGGRVDHDEYWERITYFLTRAVPVAKQHDVRLACHPYDPPGLPFGYQGADNWDSPDIFAALKRYEAIVDSPYNGFQICLGTIAEGTRNPRQDVPPIVRYFGEHGKIHQVHMRNIKGGLNEFQEVYTDEGEMDFLEIMRILRDVQFAWSICPDHMPSHPDDPGKLQAFAFGIGYIQALIRAVNSE
jgi:mannonate dehydratase